MRRRTFLKTVSAALAGAVIPFRHPQGASRGSERSRLRTFCETHYPDWFHQPWEPDQLRLLHNVEQAIISGNATLCPSLGRGRGTTSILMAGMIWAVTSGHARFVSLIARDSPQADLLFGNLQHAGIRLGLQTRFPCGCSDRVQKVLRYRGATENVLRVFPATGSFRGIRQYAGQELIRTDLIGIDHAVYQPRDSVAIEQRIATNVKQFVTSLP